MEGILSMTLPRARGYDPQMGRRYFLKLAPLGAAGWGVLAHAQSAPSSSGIPVMGDSPQLFVDLERVDLLENVQQVFHGADKTPGQPRHPPRKALGKRSRHVGLCEL